MIYLQLKLLHQYIAKNIYREKIYFDVIDTKPDNVVSLLNTECTLEFEIVAKKKDVKNVAKKKITQFKKTGKLNKFPGKGRRLCD